MDHYDAEGVSFAVRSTGSGFAEIVRRYMEEFQIPEAIGDETLYSADQGIDKALSGGKVARPVKTLYLGTLRIYRGRSQEEMAARLMSSVRDQIVSKITELVQVRAAGVNVGGVGVLLPAPPDPHLPALAGRLVADGASFLGDEIVKIEPILRHLHPTSFPLLIDESDLALFEGLTPPAPPAGLRRRTGGDPATVAITPRHPLSVSDLGGRLSEDLSVGWIVFPYFEVGAETKLEPEGGSAALFRFIQSGINLDIWGERALILMRELMESVPVSKLTVGSIPAASELILQNAPAMAAT